VPGTPAYKKFHPGDEIIEVDGYGVDALNCSDALIGSDIPGSLATISYIPYRKHRDVLLDLQDRVVGSPCPRRHMQQQVQLRRLPKDLLNSKSIMNEYLRTLRERAFENNDARSLEIVPKVRELWEETIPDDAHFDRQGAITEEASSILTLSASVVTELVSTVAQLEAFPAMHHLVQEHESLQQQVPLLDNEISELKAVLAIKVQTLERIPEVDAKLEILLEGEMADPAALTASYVDIQRLKRKADRAIACKERDKQAKEQLQQELREASFEIARLKKVVETLQDSNDPLLADIAHLNKLLADTRTDLAASQAQEKAGSERISVLVADVQACHRQLAQVSKHKDDKIDALKEQIVPLKRDIRDLEAAAETANARHSAETAELREQIKELKLLLSEESGRVASLNKRLLEITQDRIEEARKREDQREEFKAQVGDMKNKLAQATAQAEAGERSIKTLMAIKATADEATVAMQVMIEGLKRELAESDKALKDMRAACDGEVQSTQAVLAVEKRQVDELKQLLLSATQDLRQQLVDLESKREAAQVRAELNEREKKKMWDDAQKLQEVITAQDAEIAELKKQMSATQKQLQEAQDSLSAGAGGSADLQKQIQMLETEKNTLQLALDMAKDQASKDAASSQAKLADKDAIIIELQREVGEGRRSQAHVLESTPYSDNV
jgi:chromosome segregation ATPase